MPAAATVRPPRNGPIIRQRRGLYRLGSTGCASAADLKSAIHASPKTSMTRQRDDMAFPHSARGRWQNDGHSVGNFWEELVMYDFSRCEPPLQFPGSMD